MYFRNLIDSLKKGDANLLDHNLKTNPDLETGASLEKAEFNQICFLEKGNQLQGQFKGSKAGAILLPAVKDLILKAEEKGIAWASFENPRLAFAETLELLAPERKELVGIHPSAIIGQDVKIAKDAFVGPNCFIGDKCVIGNKTIIQPGVVIYENVLIGENCELHANCVIHSGTKLGNDCIINSNAVIGSEGFGFVPTNKGWRKMPQTGITILESNVEIGSCSTVDRPAVGETRIKQGTKIDNLVQIGHGVSIGKNCAMASQVGIAGGAEIGDGVILAGQVGVGNRVKVNNGVIASSKCGIHADIGPNQVISGFPAMPNRLWLKCSANFKKLPEIAKFIRSQQK